MMRHLLLLTILLSTACPADIYVVTHKDNPIEALTEQQVRDLYLARSKAWPNGEFVTVFDRHNTQLRARFFNALTGMSLRQTDAYWARLVFAGRVLPFEVISNEQALVGTAKENTNILGYTDKPPEQTLLKVLYTIKN